MAIIPSLSRGGAERVLSSLSREWSRSHDVTVVVFDGSVWAYKCGGRRVDLKLRFRGSPARKVYAVARVVVALVWWYWRESPDRIISFMEPANFPATLSAAITKMSRRVTVSVHHNPSTLPAFRQLLMRWIYRIPGRVVGVSEGVSSVLRSMGISRARVVTIPNPVEQPGAGRAGGSPFDAPYILGVGRLCRDKGFERLLRAFAHVQRSDLHLVVLGEGIERQNLLRLSRALALERRVHLPGEVSDVASWYQHAECFGLSSLSEAWGLVLVEAMANGCPVVSYNCDFGPEEIIDHDRNGFLVQEGDIEGLGRAIERVASDHSLRERFKREGRKRAMAFDVRKIAPRWLE